LISTLDAAREDQLTVRVPAAPDWTVLDVLAHVTGLAADLNAQRFPEPDDIGGTAWADRQVLDRRSRNLHDVKVEWDLEAPAFEEVLRLFGYEFGSHFVADLYTHSQDVRAALMLVADRDELTVAVALDHYLGFVDEMLTAAGWGMLEIMAGPETYRLGGDGPTRARLTAEPFDVLRMLSARRSARQIRAQQWEGDADGFVTLLRSGFVGGYSLPVDDLIE
jgi:hypothetical protein